VLISVVNKVWIICGEETSDYLDFIDHEDRSGIDSVGNFCVFFYLFYELK